jgi:hypothetical protein
MVNRSDLIAASAYSRSSFRDCSSRSSLRKRRSSEAPRLQNWNGCQRHSLGLRCAGIRPLLPKTGRGSTCPSTKASGPPAVDASNTIAVDVLGLPSAKVAGLRSPTSATAVALSSWQRTGRSGTTTSGGTSTIPTSEATGGSAGKSAVASVGVDAGAGNMSGGLGATAASAVSPSTMAAPTEGLAWEAYPMASRAAWAPHSRAPCVEASQPAWRATAPAAEAGFVLRAFLGARLAKPCLRLLKERARSRHKEKKPKQRHPRILTHSGPGPIVPAGRPLGPRSPQALPRVAPLLTPASPPPRAPEAPKGWPAQASSRWPEDQLPVQPARAPTLGGQAVWPDSPESPRLPRPRG